MKPAGERYGTIVCELAASDLSGWLHQGPIT